MVLEERLTSVPWVRRFKAKCYAILRAQIGNADRWLCAIQAGISIVVMR